VEWAQLLNLETTALIVVAVVLRAEEAATTEERISVGVAARWDSWADPWDLDGAPGHREPGPPIQSPRLDFFGGVMLKREMGVCAPKGISWPVIP
jgi:hypothetical protein